MKKILLLATCFAVSLSCFSQTSSLVVGTSTGTLGEYTSFSYHNGADGTTSLATKWKPGMGFNLGYQLHFNLSDRYSVDASILGKVQQGEVNSQEMGENGIISCNDKAWLWGGAVSGVINYHLWQGMRIGLGVEPTLLFRTDQLLSNGNKQVFDCPVLVKLGYRFKNSMEIAAYYKHGFKSIYENALFVNNVEKSKEVAISLSVPLFK
ncbi:MAG: hypothetical protein ACRCUJ_13810 [Phocaeicola sp.]